MAKRVLIHQFARAGLAKASKRTVINRSLYAIKRFNCISYRAATKITGVAPSPEAVFRFWHLADVLNARREVCF